MSLFDLRDRAVNRRLLFLVAIVMVLAGLLLGLLDGEPDKRDAETSLAHAKAVHETLSKVTKPALYEATPEEVSEFERRLAAIDVSTAPEPAPERVDDADYELYVNVSTEYLLWFFEQIGYTREHILSGESNTVPPLVTLSIPKGWADDKTVALKKSLFYRVILPLVLLENREVLETRETLEQFARKQRNKDPMPATARDEVQEIAIRYGVRKAEDITPLGSEDIQELLRRVDMVPPSLALAQAAYESGYGVSRFAYSGNALFGQWDWSSNAMKPAEHREDLGTYGIRAFDQPIDSVRAYVHNLNTHRSYSDFRQMRAQQRDGQSGRVVFDSLALTGTLLAYSERREEYTEELKGMISYNELSHADQLRLLHGEPIYID